MIEARGRTGRPTPESARSRTGSSRAQARAPQAADLARLGR